MSFGTALKGVLAEAPGANIVRRVGALFSSSLTKLDSLANSFAKTPVYQAYVKLNGNRPLPMVKLRIDYGDDDSILSFANRFDRAFEQIPDNEYLLFAFERKTKKNGREYLLVIDRKKEIAKRALAIDMNRLGINSFSCFSILTIEKERIHLCMVGLWHPDLIGSRLMLPSTNSMLRENFRGRTITTHASSIGLANSMAETFRGKFMDPHFIERDRELINPSSRDNYPILLGNLVRIGVLTPLEAKEIEGLEKRSLVYPALERKLAEKNPSMPPLQYLCSLIKKHSFSEMDLPTLPVQGIVS